MEFDEKEGKQVGEEEQVQMDVDSDEDGLHLPPSTLTTSSKSKDEPAGALGKEAEDLLQSQNKTTGSTNSCEVIVLSSDDDEIEVVGSSKGPSQLRLRTLSNPESVQIHTCLNVECKSKSKGGDFGLDLLLPPSYALSYYGISFSLQRKKKYRICPKCLQLVEKFMADSREALEKKKPLYGLTPFVPNKALVSIDIDDDSDESEESEMVSHTQDIVKLLKELDERLDIKGQVKMCEDVMSKESDELEISFNDINASLAKTDKLFEAIRKEYNDLCPPKYESVMLKSVEIDTEGDIMFSEPEPEPGPSSNSNSILPRVEIKKDTGPDVKHSPTEYDGVQDEEIVAVIPSSSKSAIKVKNTTKKNKNTILLPTPKQIPRCKPKIQDTIYALTSSQLNPWVKATIVDISVNVFNNNQDQFVVQWDKEISREKKGKGKGARGRVQETMTKTVSSKHLAYSVPCPFYLPVGTRIISKFDDEFKCLPSENMSYYAGVVAEPAKEKNDHRYLVFFDDGFAQYISPADVLLVCETSREVWQDIHPDSQEFIKDYLEKYPERPMVRLQKGTMVTTEWNGKWWTARVNETDCSMVKMHFEADNRYEWIYRGSLRLSPLYNVLKRKKCSSSQQNTTAPRHIRRGPSSRENLTIEYQYTEDDFLNNDQIFRQFSRKSRGSKQTVEPSLKPFAAQSKEVELDDLNILNLIEYEGRIQMPTIPKDVPQPKEYVLHDCSPACVIPFNNAKYEELPRPNPLSLPLFLGWAREVIQEPVRTICYRAPCGQQLGNPKELMKFLNVTEFNLGVDYFTFEFSVDCLGEFIPSRNNVTHKDLSFGKEFVPVSCCNAIDDTRPDYVEYTTQRLPGHNVHLNLEDAFLCGCDCTDNCEDKSKCLCWQLTIENTGIENNGKNNSNVGYRYRRLYDPLVTGIYECNKMCKCKQTCLNRVVQFPLRSPLQVFKTSTKDWSIRPLFDIPFGAFICVYAGQLLTEQCANEDGALYGDDYLAELDYIEVVEGLKEGYEEDVIEPGPSNKTKEDFAETTKSKKNEKKGKGRSDKESTTSEPNKVSSNMGQNNAKPEVEFKSTRELFGPDELCYVMDAKSIGNIGRYLNHSCRPNVFVQNVFVDTHDLRFPWVSFFALKHISAGTELTWDYNYEIGSVPGKKMYCFCGTPDCRGRLL